MSDIVLLHSPLTTAAVWGPLPAALLARGHAVVAPDVTEDARPPFAVRYVAAARRAFGEGASRVPVILVAHSGAGPLLPLLAATARAAHRPIARYVFLDAGLPRPKPGSRLDLMHDEDEDFAHHLADELASGARFPTWSADDLAGELGGKLPPEAAAAVAASLQPRGREFFEETLPGYSDWPDAPVTYVRLSGAYDVAARVAEHRGWEVRRLDLGHFGWWVAPETVAAALE
ncbi:MAG: hypothetical protein ACTHMZ_10740 [Actinomycetes bacterium]